MATKEEKAARLRAAREKRFETAAAAAEHFNWKEVTYRSHENGTRGFNPDDARKYGRAFKVKPGWLLGIDGIDDQPPTETPTAPELHVNAAVEAGAWSTDAGWDDDRQFWINVASPIPSAKRFGFLVQGRSMDKVYEPGTVLDCVSIFKNGVKPRTGDHVIAQHTKIDGLQERTVKEFREDGGRYFLVPQSTDSRYQDEIEIGSPTEGHVGDDRVEVIAFVVAHYPPRVLQLFDRMGLLKRSR